MRARGPPPSLSLSHSVCLPRSNTHTHALSLTHTLTLTPTLTPTLTSLTPTLSPKFTQVLRAAANLADRCPPAAALSPELADALVQAVDSVFGSVHVQVYAP